MTGQTDREFDYNHALTWALNAEPDHARSYALWYECTLADDPALGDIGHPSMYRSFVSYLDA